MCLRNCLNGLGATGTSPGGTPRSSQAVSPTFDLRREYALALQSNSYSEIRSTIYVLEGSQEELELHFDEQDCSESTQEQVLLRVLQPSRKCVEEALQHAEDNVHTRLVSAYFDHSESTSNLYLLLYQSVHRARVMYSPLGKLLAVLPLDADSFTQSQCNRVYDVFVQFDSHDNPFPSPASHNFSEMRSCFSQLKQQLDYRLKKSKSRVKFVRHAIAGFSKKELAHAAQLKAAAKGTFCITNDLDTIKCLVDRLDSAVEDDKLLIRVGLERGTDKNPILEVVKQICKSHAKFHAELSDLEKHICLCLNGVNRARNLLLEEITFHHSIAS